MYIMINFLKHQKTIGVIGKGLDADKFIIEANELGYETLQLIQETEQVIDVLHADKLFQGSLCDEKIQEEFVMATDLLVYFDHSLQAAELKKAQKAVVTPQGEDLLAIAQDRSLQKAFYESIGVNIAPYQMVVNKEDIYEAIPSLGYPAVLRRNVIQEDEFLDSHFIYEEADIEEASRLLSYGPAVLESWIVTEHQLAITAVKSATGEIQFYPIIEKHYKNERLAKIMKFEREDEELIGEIKKAAQLILANISFVGVISIEFVISPAQALYLGRIHPYPNILSRYTEGNPLYSSLQTHLRAVSSLPITELKPEAVDFAYYPLYADQQEQINQAILAQPQGLFHFLPTIKKGAVDLDDEIGYFLTTNKEWTL